MFSGGLDFDQFVAGRHDEVHVDVGAGVFFVAEVEQDFSVDNSYTHGGNKILQGSRGQGSGFHQFFQSQSQRDEGAGDRGGARAAVGLDHVAIDPDGALAQAGEVGHGPQAAPDQALDFVRAPAGAALCDFPRRAGQGGAGKHAVFARDPSLARVAHELRDGFLNRSGANDTRIAYLNQNRTFRGGDEVWGDENGPEL